MGEILDVLFSEPKIIISLVIAALFGFAVGSHFGFFVGTVGFGASFVVVLTLLLVRARSRRR